MTAEKSPNNIYDIPTKGTVCRNRPCGCRVGCLSDVEDLPPHKAMHIGSLLNPWIVIPCVEHNDAPATEEDRMTNTTQLLDAARDAQRAYQADPTAEHKGAAIAAQRAYDQARWAELEAERQAEREAEADAARAMVEERLARPVPVDLPTGVVGLCTTAHARRVMMAAAVAGGAIWVGLDASALALSEGRPGTGWLLAEGDLGVQARLPRWRVIEWLREELAHLTHPLLKEERDRVIAVLDRIENGGASR